MRQSVRGLKSFSVLILLAAVVGASAAQAATITVTSREDSGPGTLRQAIADANSGDTILFDTAAMGGNSITVYTGLNVNKSLTIDGEDKQVVIGMSTSAVLLNLGSAAANSVLQNLSLVDAGQALYLYQAHDARILNCRIGVDWADTARGNSWGIMVQECQRVVIGAPGQGNVISGNTQYGIVLKTSTNTIIQANRIGTNSAGTAARPNAVGIRVLDGTLGTLIGGSGLLGQGNVVSGNSSYGVEISNSDGYGGTGAAATGNTLAGNVIGLNQGQTARLQNNSHGVFLQNSPHNFIGLPELGKGNVIAGNGSYNLAVTYCDHTRVQNNRVGLNESDTSFGNNYGVSIGNSKGCLVGGDRNASAHERNIVSGHNVSGRFGIICGGPASAGNTISGNIVGLDSTGTVARPNHIGVQLYGSGSLVGGANHASALNGNLISGNTVGLELIGAGHRALGNWIGLNAAGTGAVPNGVGVSLSGTASTYCEIGDGTAGGRNVISGNSQDGIKCSGGFGHRILNNYIGTSADGLQQVSNQGYPVRLFGAGGCMIGQESAGNLICGSAGWHGVSMTSPECAGNTLVANWFNLLANRSLAPEAIEDPIIMELGPHDNSVGLKSTGVGNLIVGADNAITLASSTTINNGLFGNTICGFANTMTALGIRLISGANNGKDAPIINNASAALISGISGAPNDHIQIFRSDRAEGYAGGSLALLATVIADGSGNWSWTPSGLVYGDVVTTLATDTTNNTSQFSNNMFVTGLATPTPTPTPTSTPALTSAATSTPTPTPTSALSGADLGGRAVVAFPNPAKDRMTFVFHLEQAARVEIHIYNLAGEQAAALSGNFAAGRGQSLEWDCQGTAPGIYLARMLIGGEEKVKIKVGVVKK